MTSEHPHTHRAVSGRAESSAGTSTGELAASDAPRPQEPPPEPPPEPAPVAGPSTFELAAPSRRARRRARDRRALLAALGVTLMLAAGVGVAGWLWIQNLPEATSRLPTSDPDEAASAELAARRPPQTGAAAGSGRPEGAGAARRPGFVSTELDETPDLPALRRLQDEGLTLGGAEGLPDVRGQLPAQLAGLLSCRFAFGVWEFSPNHRFRFLTTCGHEAQRVWVGAYGVEGTQIATSPLQADGVTWSTVFQLQKPTHLVTQVQGPDGPITIRQKLTAVTPGLKGEGFRSAFSEKNRLTVQGVGRSQAPAQAPTQPPPTEVEPPPRDPLLDLLRQ